MELEKVILKYAYNHPDIVGESLRDFCFIKKNSFDFGGYSCFNLKEEFVELSKNNSYGTIILKYLGATDEDFVQIFQSITKEMNITIAWMREGDNTLLFVYNDKILINTDCKKDHGWEFLNTGDI